ncbi:MAG: transglutaminase domain-containing protein [Salinibacterium sp.]|nr:transglutaminase domain-containing protein [Salinibacterium sp.]
MNTAMLWLTTVVASTALWPIYRSTSLIILVGVALAVGTAIAIVGAEFRWSSVTVLLTSVAAFLVIGVPLAVPGKAQFGVLPTLGGFLDLVAGVALGWKQLLTISLPVGDYQALLVPALVLVFGSTVIGLTVALRARFGELAVLFPVALFLAATAFGPRFPDRPLIAPLALLVGVLFWLVWFRWYRRRESIRQLSAQSAALPIAAESGFSGLRTVLSAAVVLAIGVAAAVVAVDVVPPAADRTVLRTSMEQPFDPRDYVSPLSGFRSYWQPPTVGDVLLQVSGLPAGARLRVATLDSYDGVVYAVGSDSVSSLSGSFTRVPSTVDQSRVTGDQVTVAVTVGDYTGVWLPTVGKLESVAFGGTDATALRDAFYYNDTSGTAAVVRGVVKGDTYTIDAVLPAQPTTAQLASLEPGSATVPAPTNVPDELTAKLDEYTTGIEGAGKRLVAMLAGLKTDGYISHGVGPDEPASRSGHAADRLAELISSPRMIGDAEQYAVVAALMADDLGFPSRVVMGFLPTSGEVTGADVSAWIEVDTAQYGWVAIDPTPEARDIPEEDPQENAQVARPQTIVPPPVVESERVDRQTTPDSQQELPPDLNPVIQALFAIARGVGIGLLVLGIILAPFVLVVAAKIRRRRLRRHAPNALERISGGWQEFEDSVVDHGLSPAATATRSEVASIAGGMQSQVLAAVADRANFAPDDPVDSDADSVWRAVDELQASLDAGLTRWQRLRARISLRSLGGYSVRRLFRERKTGP